MLSPTTLAMLLTMSIGQATEPVRILVPAYFPVNPGAPDDGLKSWNSLIASQEQGRVQVIAVVNVGQGFRDDPQKPVVGGGPFIPKGWDANVTKNRYADVLGRATRAKVGLTGYVSTAAGQRPIREIQRDIDQWLTWPGITGIFLDEQATCTPTNPNTITELLPYYREIRKYASEKFQQRRKQAGLTDENLAHPLIVSNVGNVGARPEELARYLGDGAQRPVSDILVIREDAGSEVARFDPPKFTAKLPASRFAALLHGVADINDVKLNDILKSKRFGNIYVTDAPWGSVPKYWDREVKAIQQYNSVRKTASPVKTLPIPGETFTVNDRPAFLILPKDAKSPKNVKTPWVWYAPTLPGLPGPEETWMFERFTRAGLAVAGIDIGESFGSPAGRALCTAFYEDLVTNRNMSATPCLLVRSRGGLMLYNWAVEHPSSVACIAGIYPVCNLQSYPGLAKASAAYALTTEQLQTQLTQHNPIDRLAPLARARVPIYHIHGDHDAVVPLEDNSGIVAQRYAKMGGPMTLNIVKDQGHTMWPGWFQSQELVDFVIAHARPKTPAKP